MQMLFRKQLMSLRDRISYSNIMNDFDAKSMSYLATPRYDPRSNTTNNYVNHSSNRR